MELSFFEGQIPQGTGLVEFIKNVISRRGNYTRQEQVDSAVRADAIMWQRGIQAVGDISNDDASFKAKQGSKIKYHTFGEYFGMPRKDEARAKYLKDTAHMAVAHDMGLVATPTPHSTYLVSDELFSYANESDRLSVHFMETPSEIELFHRRGGMYEFMMESGMEPDFLHYAGHAKRLVAQTNADKKTILIHNTQIQPEDVDMIASHFGDNVTFGLCPRSNYYIERGTPPAYMLWQKGVRVALGTDSLSSNTSLDIASEIESIMRSDDRLPLEVVLHWATQSGAEALGLDDEIGSLEEGLAPGLVLLEGVDMFTMRPKEDGTHITARRLI